MKPSKLVLLFASLAIFVVPARAQVPQLINYQGRVAVGTTNFNGSGAFKFALVNAAATTTYWSNDGSSTAGAQPTAAVTLTVNNGVYSGLLGDTALANMTAIPNSVFSNADVRLRVWFNDGTNGSQLLTPDQRIAAVGYAMMAAGVPDGAITALKIAEGAVGSSQLAAGAVTSTRIANGAVGSSQLEAGAAAANLNSSGQSGVASGGIVMSATDNNAALSGAGYLRIGAVALGEAWSQRQSAAIAPRSRHGAVWTGSEMIVWGGYDGTALNTGARFSPGTNSWGTVNPTGAPAARYEHTAVWTGSELIVWGGQSNNISMSGGGRYNPATFVWATISTTGAPSARHNHTAVWTGSEMIIWGGYSSSTNASLNDGARYNPATNSWTAVTATGAPSARNQHTAVWTGSEMIIWGADFVGNTGGRYNPAGNSWTAISTTGAPSERNAHTAVWTGSGMIVWGGTAGALNLGDGGRYNPTSNSWTAVSTVGAPGQRYAHSAVWTGSEMIVWGGRDGTFLGDGGRYNPTSNTWITLAAAGAPERRYTHSGVWTGNEMIIFGGFTTPTGYLADTIGYTPGRAMVLYQRP